ncbi:unnamed protein product [Rhizophagus irregularis]|nr:unnamed protein product [Rhizophagus irregularis]
MAQYRPHGQTLRSAVLPHNVHYYMAPRPSYGILLGGISQMAAPGSEIEKLTSFHWEDITAHVLRALRVLGGEGSGDDKKVNSDENTRKYLAQYEASRPGTVHDTELDKNALLKMLKT